MIRRLVGWAAWLGWAAVCAWGAWCFWRPFLTGPQGRPVAYGADAETGQLYGVRLTPLSTPERAAAAAREAAALAEPGAFADGA